MSRFQGNSIFWVDVEKIKPNPYQPRKEFTEENLSSLADSIKQYGVLQPLTVTRHEIQKEDGGLVTQYELIAGERRLRASKLAGIQQVPVTIRTGEDSALEKLELAIIENVQREDLNPIDRALAFQQLVDQFGLKHAEVAKKVGKSREYVSNSLRLLGLPEEIRRALINGKISEGHARTLMMLKDRPEEQATLYKEVVFKGLTVREAESIARRIAKDKVRKSHNKIDPEILQLEDKISRTLGTRVQIQSKDKAQGGKVVIDFFSPEDLQNLINQLQAAVPDGGAKDPNAMMNAFIASQATSQMAAEESDAPVSQFTPEPAIAAEAQNSEPEPALETASEFAPAPEMVPIKPVEDPHVSLDHDFAQDHESVPAFPSFVEVTPEEPDLRVYDESEHGLLTSADISDELMVVQKPEEEPQMESYVAPTATVPAFGSYAQQHEVETSESEVKGQVTASEEDSWENPGVPAIPAWLQQNDEAESVESVVDTTAADEIAALDEVLEDTFDDDDDLYSVDNFVV